MKKHKNDRVHPDGMQDVRGHSGSTERMEGAQATPKSATQTTNGTLQSLEKRSFNALESALTAVRELATARAAAKLSSSRLAGVARELRELIKVMSVYGC
jgi:hypothetical protein